MLVAEQAGRRRKRVGARIRGGMELSGPGTQGAGFAQDADGERVALADGLLELRVGGFQALQCRQWPAGIGLQPVNECGRGPNGQGDIGGDAQRQRRALPALQIHPCWCYSGTFIRPGLCAEVSNKPQRTKAEAPWRQMRMAQATCP